MGAGKSTVAKILAREFGATAVDLDTDIEARAGASIPEIFTRDGEAGFRALERQAVLELPPDGVVVALGGGAVTQREVRHSLIENDILITLTGDVRTLAERVGDGSGRPLLRDGVELALERILDERRAAYAECHAVIDTTALSTEQIAGQVRSVVARNPIAVPLGERTYNVEVGAGIRSRLATLAGASAPGKVVLVHDGSDGRPWPAEAEAALRALPRDVVPVCLPAGETHKTVETVESIWDAALEAGVDRQGIVIGVGGGVVGDLAAFAASTLLRGVALGQLPTTLLAMVDSSVGGKTGFNRPRGKNLVGTFYQPKFVICDVETLTTLPSEERIAGLAEVVKSAWLDGEASVELLERFADALIAGDEDATIAAIRMSVRLKSRIVRMDERESGTRMLLNLGHTVGHGLEASHGYSGLRHGEAVALGMLASMRVAERLGGSKAQTQRLAELLKRLGLPHDLDAHLSDSVFEYMRSDKKRRADEVKFIVPRLPGETDVVSLDFSTIEEAVRRR